MRFQIACATNGLGQEPLWLDAAALQFGFYRLKDDLGWHHNKIGPEDDRSARGDEVVGHAVRVADVLRMILFIPDPFRR
jgi:hypothetical protein